MEPLPANRIRLAWDDGARSVVDLTPVLAKGGVFALLTDPAAFNAVAVGARGRILVWRDPEGDEIELSADALWRLAHQWAPRRPDRFLSRPERYAFCPDIPSSRRLAPQLGTR